MYQVKGLKKTVHQVQDLVKVLNQVEASERQAWNWLEAVDAENSVRVGDLRQYISSMELNKRQTSEAIAQLLQIECDLRQQINRKRSSTTGLLSTQSDDAVLDELSRSLRTIVRRLQTQHGSSFPDITTPRADHSTGPISKGSQAELTTRSHNGGTAGGVESDEGYDGNSSSLMSESLSGRRTSEPTSGRVALLESEVVRLTRLLDAYRWSHGDAKSTERRGVGQLGAPPGNLGAPTRYLDASLQHLGARPGYLGASPRYPGAPPGYLDANLQQAHADLRRLQSRVTDVESERLELERESNKATSKLRDDLEKLETKLQLQKNESNLKISEMKEIENDLNRTTRELKEQLEIEKDKRQSVERKLLDAVEVRDELRQQLQETSGSVSGLRDKLEMSEQSNKQLVAQVSFLTKTNDSLMEDIDDNNERMSEELSNCRHGKTAAELRCSELEAHCQKLTETIGLLAERARGLEASLEEAQKERVECERLRHEHSVLVASEEKLVDKITDKDEMVKRLMEELSELKRLFQEQAKCL